MTAPSAYKKVNFVDFLTNLRRNSYLRLTSHAILPRAAPPHSERERRHHRIKGENHAEKRVLSLILALSCTAALLGGCAGSDTSDGNAASGEHEVITMNAPYRNMSQFYDLVHEKYPEINLEIIPYNGENTSS